MCWQLARFSIALGSSTRGFPGLRRASASNQRLEARLGGQLIQQRVYTQRYSVVARCSAEGGGQAFKLLASSQSFFLTFRWLLDERAKPRPPRPPPISPSPPPPWSEYTCAFVFATISPALCTAPQMLRRRAGRRSVDAPPILTGLLLLLLPSQLRSTCRRTLRRPNAHAATVLPPVTHAGLRQVLHLSRPRL